MTVSLSDITKDNFKQAIKLKVAPGQEHFVATNAYSIAQSKFYPSWVCLGIFDDETMVGFLMHGLDDDDGSRWIIRLMVGADLQGKGYGRATMKLILDRFRADPACKKVSLSYEPDNAVAQKLYASLGFRETGEIEEGELIARLTFEQPVEAMT